MNDLLIYLLKVIAIQGVLYIIYALVFHKSGRHAFNRGFIISAIAFSFIIPLLPLPGLNTAKEIVETETPIWYEIAEYTGAKNVELIPVVNVDKSASMSLFIITGIVLVSLLLVLKMIFSHFQLIRLMKHSDSVIKNGHPIYISKTENPFSYFKAIFMPEYVINSSSFDIILQHELVHVRKWHSLDRILIEVATSILWFNPFHFLYRNRLIETHEFQADEGVITVKKDPIAYQEVLYEQSHTQYAMATANYFKLNTIKTRIKMINKKQKQSKWHYLLILPVFAILTISFASKENIIAANPLPTDIGDLFENLLNEQDSFTPSIFPLQDAEGVKLTTGVGKYIHPIIKAERMHDGIDLKTYSGNPVLATADGIVIEASVSYGGYGKKITIDHNGVYQTFYGHLSELKVKKGDIVKRGDVVGASGTTGAAVEPHLHYEVRNASLLIEDPVDFIKNYVFKTNSLKTESLGLSLVKANQKVRVVIDAGHGGKDDGISASGAMEKDITLKVAIQVAKHFQNSDEVEIILTRKNDELISLEDRVSESSNADLFISLHVETHEDEKEDMMTAIYNYQNNYAESSKSFAELLSTEFEQIDKKLKVGFTEGYYILKNAKSPAILFNIGYISDEASKQYLNSKEGTAQVAKELSEAIILFRNL